MRSAFAPGKIILSGEYAVVFGYRGIAVPLSKGVHADFNEDWELGSVVLQDANEFVERAAKLCASEMPAISGTLTVRSDIPVGKGLGSSSATVIAIVRALLGDKRDVAQKIEEAMTPGVSGIDFSTCWENAPTIFKKGSEPEIFQLPKDLLQDALLIDTGKPAETTSELVAWIKSRESELLEPLKIIGACTEKLVDGAKLSEVVREHHQAQVALGVVPEEVLRLIDEIETEGYAGKVVGAGGRTAGAGLVLALGDTEKIKTIAAKYVMPILSL